MKRLIYTAVFNGYDRVYPPVHPEADVDYLIVTDDAGLKVPGWQVFHADMSHFATPKAANRYHKALIHRLLPGYDASLYVDGNIRLLGPTEPLFEQLERSGTALMIHRHPQRQTVAEELEAVIAAGKITDVDQLRREFRSYLADGFPDNTGLGENGIILKNHRHAELDRAMVLWWSLFETHLSRDQLSLPYVIWKTGLDIAWLPGTFREPNAFFALYPHYRAKGVNPQYANVRARAHDSLPHRLLLLIWHASWSLRRVLRRLKGVAK